jgi:hypothetical protein
MTARMAPAGFNVTVGASPSGELNIQHEIEVLKPALLYGDTVTLLSPVVASFRFVADTGSLSLREAMERTVKFSAERDPEAAAEARAYLDERDRLAGLGWRTASERERWATLQAIEERYTRDVESGELGAKLDQFRTLTGIDALRQAEESGLLRIDPFMEPDDFLRTDQVRLQMNAYLLRLIDLLSAGASYPLFDDYSGLMVKAAEIDGLFTSVELIDSRGKQIGTASHLLRRLPTFPEASITDILDIRRELQEPLVRFRSAMIEFASQVEGAPYDKDFNRHAEELACARVDPAMLEIEELVRDNKYYKQFQRKAVENIQTMAPVLTVGVSLLTDLPILIGPALATLQALWEAELDRRKEQNKIRRHQLYLLHRTNELLAKPE